MLGAAWTRLSSAAILSLLMGLVGLAMGILATVFTLGLVYVLIPVGFGVGALGGAVFGFKEPITKDALVKRTDEEKAARGRNRTLTEARDLLRNQSESVKLDLLAGSLVLAFCLAFAVLTQVESLAVNLMCLVVTSGCGGKLLGKIWGMRSRLIEPWLSYTPTVLYLSLHFGHTLQLVVFASMVALVNMWDEVRSMRKTLRNAQRLLREEGVLQPLTASVD